MVVESPWKLGVDVGGTFTDAVLYNDTTGDTFRAKVLSTPEDQSVGVLNAIEQIMNQVPDKDAIDIAVLNHGTTVATNAVLEGKGARVALLVTEGYKDILQVRRSHVPGGLAGWIVWPKPVPLAPLEMTIEVSGRISSSGEIVRPFDEAALRASLSRLKQLSDPPQSITISLINSFANPCHERQVADVVKSEWPGLPLSLSSEILPEIMEYERTVTTVANAYVKPVIGTYLQTLQEKLGKTELRVLRSDGGLAGVKVAVDHCASLLYSGPAGGVAGVVSQVCNNTEYKNILTFDIGGTSTDVCLVQDGIPDIRRESTIGDLSIRAPSIDVRTVGAGGGSIATVAEITGALRVGPESAGAIPGPVCYANGGKLPTVTDALASAKTAVQTEVADILGLTVHDAAEGILSIVIEKMYGSLRSVSIEKGKDPRDFHLTAFGGAGGLFACELTKLCGTSYPTIIPPSPGVLCAFGDASTAMRHETSVTVLRRLSELSTDEILSMCSNLQTQVSAGKWEADLRFHGQATSLPVSFTFEDLSTKGPDVLRQRFLDIHKQLFTFCLDLDVEILNIRAIAEEIIRHAALPAKAVRTINIKEAITSRTAIYYGGQTWSDVPIYERASLFAGDQLPGPCIVTEIDSNTLITPFHYASVDHVGNILIWKKAGTIAKEITASSEVSVDAIVVQLVEASLQTMSPAMREQLDYFPMIAAGEGPNSGKMVCGQFGSFIPGFLSIWDESIVEGDVFLTNDPYSVSNAVSHLNDFLVITPIFYQGKLVSWAANLGHFTDIGSVVPGSMPNCATSIFEDGLQIPICKLYSAGVPNTAVFKIVERNSRKPDFARSDLQALVAATRIASRRVIEMCERFGRASYEAALDRLLARNKSAVGKLIHSTIPNEPIYFEDYIDDDGFGLGPWKVACTMTKIIDEKEGEVVLFDFEGTDPQSDRSINFALSHDMMKMFVVFYLLTVFDPSTVVNDGSYDLIKVSIPEGTILNPIRPAALSCRTHLLGRIFDVIGALFGQRQPEFLSAAGFSDSPHFFYSGWTKEGEWFQLYQIGFGGIPARPHGDGPDGHSLWPSMRSVPNEFLESYLPLRVDRYETVPDSGGEGLYRGGNAMRIDYTFLEPGNISVHDDRWLTKPWGVHGGGVGGRSKKTLVRYSEDPVDPPRKVIGSKEDFVAVFPGDVLEWVTWGGALGNPLEREPQLVAKEVRQGLIRNTSRYGVVLDAKGDVDVEATIELRQQMLPKQQLLSQNLFNRGGTLKEIFAACEEETGLPAPALPSSRMLRGPVAQLKHIQTLHRKRQEEDKQLFV
ncbi:hypothetical protein BDZ89DRAFT_1071218 [Hymenopellis radicata]|nr:hypothetical protein BDZ89DRAFT_1071218 [Hymenopellis radicata]